VGVICREPFLSGFRKLLQDLSSKSSDLVELLSNFGFTTPYTNGNHKWSLESGVQFPVFVTVQGSCRRQDEFINFSVDIHSMAGLP